MKRINFLCLLLFVGSITGAFNAHASAISTAFLYRAYWNPSESGAYYWDDHKRQLMISRSSVHSENDQVHIRSLFDLLDGRRASLILDDAVIGKITSMTHYDGSAGQPININPSVLRFDETRKHVSGTSTSMTFSNPEIQEVISTRDQSGVFSMGVVLAKMVMVIPTSSGVTYNRTFYVTATYSADAKSMLNHLLSALKANNDTTAALLTVRSPVTQVAGSYQEGNTIYQTVLVRGEVSNLYGMLSR